MEAIDVLFFMLGGIGVGVCVCITTIVFALNGIEKILEEIRDNIEPH